MAQPGYAAPMPRGVPRESSALELTLTPLQCFLHDPTVTELCINRPGGVFLERRSGWCYEPLAVLDYPWCRRLAKLVANFSSQRVDEGSPLLSGYLPEGQRVQLALPPACPGGVVAICIRRPAAQSWSIEELAARGVFDGMQRAAESALGLQAQLLQLLAQRQLEAFMRMAVRARLNLLVSGPTGSGKTTWTRALIREIPAEERLITIEDTPELSMDRHPNHVRLLYSKDDQGRSRVTARQLLEACLRMRPDRILLAELRGEEAFEYLRNANSGHPGSITSVHATSAELAFEQLVLLVKLSPAGRTLSREEIKELLYRVVDVVIQFESRHGQRYIREIWYEPARKRSGPLGASAASAAAAARA
ncbi:MAG TPA: P-type DNA transfer ATPase VirB11 [Steroidobacteraceae bacterium]|jgi:type IV secretion system protein VirB11